MYTIFKQNDLLKFRLAIQQYCEKMQYSDFILSDSELLQLSWSMGNSITSPEVSIVDILEKFDFEIQRGLARRYSFELLLRGDEKAYQQFVQAQIQKLSIGDFKKLAAEAQALDKDILVCIKVSCFLVPSDTARSELKNTGITLSNDAEEFLSQFSLVAKEDRKIFPITSQLNIKQLDLLRKLYWPNMHLRHMLYTEGGEAMTISYKDGITVGDFNSSDFIAWKWRWLTNLFGFQSGPGAKYYDFTTHMLTSYVLTHLEKMLKEPTYSYLENYLATRAQLAGLNISHHLNLDEQNLLAHIAAYYHRINILTPQLGNSLVDAYREFHDNGLLAKKYEQIRKDLSTVTPTYLPAVINNAFDIFNKKLNVDDSIKNSCLFMLQLLQQIYALSQNVRISCMKLADKKILEPMLDQWLKNKDSIEFKLNEKFEIQALLKEQVAALKFC